MTGPQPTGEIDGVARPSAAALAAVRDSCRAVAERPVLLAEVFYAHLFEMAPDLRVMFPDDLTGQMQNMTDTLLGAIAALDDPDTDRLVGTLRRLGAAHAARYQVRPEHYRYVGHALTRAVRDIVGAGYSGFLSSSWIGLTMWVSGQMIEGAEEAARSPRTRPAVALPQQRAAVEPSRGDRMPLVTKG